MFFFNVKELVPEYCSDLAAVIKKVNDSSWQKLLFLQQMQQSWQWVWSLAAVLAALVINAHWKDSRRVFSPRSCTVPAPAASPPTSDAWVSSPSLWTISGPALHAHVSLVLGSPEWDTASQMGSDQYWTECSEDLSRASKPACMVIL